MDLVTAGEMAGLVVAVGGSGVVVSKGMRAVRRFARFLDGWFGDGTVKHPSVLDRLEALEVGQTEMKARGMSIEHKLDEHVDSVAPSLLADGQAWGRRLDEQVAGLDTRVSSLEHRTDLPTLRNG